jgi:hypothetical protein
MCFCIALGSILAPFSHQSACFSAPFSSFVRSCSAKGALSAPFPPFWLHFDRLLAPIGLPFGIPSLPFGSLLVAFAMPALRLAPPALHLGYLWLPLFPFCHFGP